MPAKKPPTQKVSAIQRMIGSLIVLGTVLGVPVGAEPLLEGRVRLESGAPVADAQVRLFDLTDLQQGAIARAQTDGTGYFALPLAALRGSALPEGFALGPNYPNPFNPSTIIPYQLAASSQVRLEVFNLLGQRIATLVDGERPAGFHTATWYATDAAGRAVGAGVYIYRMTVGVESQTGRMVLIDGQAGAAGAVPVLPRASGGSRSDGEDAQVYGLIVSGSGLVPYVDSAFRVESGMAPVELVVSARLYSAGKATDDDCPLCDFFDAINDMAEEEAEEEEDETTEEEKETTEEEGSDALVTIPDIYLRAAIEKALGKASGATITKGDMETLNDLEAVTAGISDLTGLEFATNLTGLELGGNTIADISALSGLTNLRVLGLRFTNVTDISALSGLTNLTELWLGANTITDISALSGLTNLTWLDLEYNNISDISALSGLTNLTELWLNDNPLSASSINDHIPALQDRGVTVTFDPTPSTITITDDPTPVTIRDAKLRAAIEAALSKASGASITKGDMTTLTKLEAVRAGISDLTGLEYATNLTDLSLFGNDISDISVLRGLTNLTALAIGGNDISDISVLRGLTNLRYLFLAYNNISDVSVLRGLTTLERLSISYNDISDISVLRGLTNLEILRISGNDISDISVLRGLTNLGWLNLEYNDISDISVLRGLTNLEGLFFEGNDISDISVLRSLTKLGVLWIPLNNISDVSPLRDLTNLGRLNLAYNNISDVSPLRDLTKLTELDLRGNLLSDSSINDHIPALQSRGAMVSFHKSFRTGDFDIELVFLGSFTESQKNVFRYVARRWMSVVTEDLPDYEFTQGWSDSCEDHSLEIPAGERIDDLRIYITNFDGGGFTLGWGGPSVLRETTHLPVVGCMGVDLFWASIPTTARHEIGHVLGFGTIPIWDDYLSWDADPHFNGPLAVAAFDDAGGRDYTGAKVPLGDWGHWRYSVLEGELMVPDGGGALSAITVQALADMGYGVDVTQADPYTLPGAASAKASAKIAAALLPTLADVYTLPGVQGRIAGALPLIPGDNRLRGRLESTEEIGGRGFDFASRDNRLTERLALAPHAEPKRSCGVGTQRKLIYVVDPQGRIIRTINRKNH